VADLAQVLFKIMGILIKLAPLGVLSAIAFTVGKYGLGSLKQLGMLVALFYAAVAIFVFVILGSIMRIAGLSLVKLLAPARGTGRGAGHHLVRQRAAADHGQAAPPGHPRFDRRRGHSHRLLVHPRCVLDLHHAGRGVQFDRLRNSDSPRGKASVRGSAAASGRHPISVTFTAFELPDVLTARDALQIAQTRGPAYALRPALAA
jgi:hypothetical protein